MDVRKIVVLVEDVDAARTALHWALHNLIRYGDLITLLHVFPSSTSKSKNKARLLRLKGFQLALSFKDICSNFPNTNIEIVVTEGDDQEGGKISAMVREIGASVLVVGLHGQSFLYRLAMANENIGNQLNCRVLAIKQPTPLSPSGTEASGAAVTTLDMSPSNTDYMDFSQIEIARLLVPEVHPPKIPYRICPNPSAIIWRSKSRRRSGR